MRIDVIHMRDPDSECDIEVYVDGERVGVHMWSFDPGAGYEREQIAEMRQDEIDMAPYWLKPRIEQIWDEMEPAYEKWGL